MKRESKLSWLTISACILTAHNPELLRVSPFHERLIVVGEAMLLMLVACSSGTAWALFMMEFGSLPAGIACGLFAFAFILLLDRAIGSAEWTLSGILRKPGFRHDWRLLIRLLITMVFSVATSLGAIMAMEHTAIVRQIEYDRLEENKQISAYHEVQKNDVRNHAFGSVIADIASLKVIVAATTPLLDAARKVQADATSQQQTAEAEAKRERDGGPGYVSCPKSSPRIDNLCPKYHAALKQKHEADAALAHANTEVAIYEPRLTDANAKLEALNVRLQAGEESIKDELAKIEEQKQARLVPEGYDAAMAYIALRELEDVPKRGRAILFFSYLMTAVLLTVELSYILVKIVFSPASISMALQIKQYKLEAETINAEYELKSHNIRTELAWEIGPKPERPPFRIISRGTPS